MILFLLLPNKDRLQLLVSHKVFSPQCFGRCGSIHFPFCKHIISYLLLLSISDYYSLLTEADDTGDIPQETEGAKHQDEHTARPEPGHEQMQHSNEEKKNPAYGRHQLSRPMRIIGPIQI